MMCAAQAGQRGRTVLMIDHSAKLGEKIRISGGGRCNFTNLHTSPTHFLSHNPHFCKSALSQYSVQDFIALVEKHGIAYHEKKLGQLFCDNSANDIIDMLRAECEAAGVIIQMETSVSDISSRDSLYVLGTSKGAFSCTSLVIATGGLSIPKIGASKFGYEVAKQFSIPVLETRAALVPLTFQADFLEMCKELSGVSIEASVQAGKISFAEGLLFTHRGFSGPSILQISSYWTEGQPLAINLAPQMDITAHLIALKTSAPKKEIQTALGDILPQRLVEKLCALYGWQGKLADLSHKVITDIGQALNEWQVKPSGTEGYRTAEVTLHGVDTNALNSKTMEVKAQPGLYFIGEVVDVTGHLGGFNFQWAWSSGFVAGQHV